MTFCKELMSKSNGKDTITAWELWDKNSLTPRYEITISRDSIAYEVIPTARTTWKKKFNEITK